MMIITTGTTKPQMTFLSDDSQQLNKKQQMIK